MALKLFPLKSFTFLLVTFDDLPNTLRYLIRKFSIFVCTCQASKKLSFVYVCMFVRVHTELPAYYTYIMINETIEIPFTKEFSLPLYMCAYYNRKVSRFCHMNKNALKL